MIAAKWYDMVVGVDIHIVMVPTPAGPVPTPLPHPFVGLIFDPAGFAIGSLLSGGAVLINNMPAANTGTEGTNKMVMPHIPTPPGVAWAPVPAAPKPPVPGKPPSPPMPTPMPSNDTILITGSKTVHIGGTNACRLGDMAMNCAEPVRIPNGAVIAVPMGMPVIVGGPPALDLMAGLMAMARTKFVTGALRRLTRAAEGSWRAKFICLLTGHPVDVASGMMLTDAVDVELPGPIPVRFERTYHSRGAAWTGALGWGWGHNYDESIRFDDRRITLRAGDGRELYFDMVGPGGSTRNESEGLELVRHGSEIHVTGRDRLTHIFAPSYRQDGSWPLHQIRNARGHRIAFRYDDLGRLVEMTDSADRLIRIQNDAEGRMTAIRLPHPDRPGAFFDAVRYAYDAEGDLVEVRDALGEPMRYHYKHHLMVQETQRNGLSFYFAYDGIAPDSRCVRTWGDGGIFDHVLTYDTDRGITLKEDSYGYRTVYMSNDAGLVETIIDSLGRERKFAYDDSLRRVSETDAEGNVFEIEYDGAAASGAWRMPMAWDASSSTTISARSWRKCWAAMQPGAMSSTASVSSSPHAIRRAAASCRRSTIAAMCGSSAREAGRAPSWPGTSSTTSCASRSRARRRSAHGTMDWAGCAPCSCPMAIPSTTSWTCATGRSRSCARGSVPTASSTMPRVWCSVMSARAAAVSTTSTRTTTVSPRCARASASDASSTTSRAMSRRS
jgi:YD repeat-containing protein